MNIRTMLRTATAPIGLCAALAAHPVLAQDNAPGEEVVVTEVDNGEIDDVDAEGRPVAGGETIIVTGSRIRRDEFTSPSPISIVDPQIAVRQGLFDTGSMIQGSPIAAGSSQVTGALASQFLTNGGQGAQTISLRGLGAERTLVLLNGRRAGPAGTQGAVSAFDLNVLPQSIVQRVDILKDGASSIYGSDAVAGVVNLITKTDTDGVEFDFFGSVPFKEGGESWSASATWGKTFDRGHVLVSGNYYRQNELARGDRSYLKCAEAYIFTDRSNESRADLIDPRTGDYACAGNDSNTAWGHVWTYDYSYYYSPDGSNLPEGVGTVLLQYDYPGSNLGQYIPGVGPMTNPGQIMVPAGWYPVGYDPASQAVYNNYHPAMDHNTVTPETNRYTLYLDAAYEIVPQVELYTELLYNRRQTYYNATGQAWQFGIGEYDLGHTASLYGLPVAFEAGDPLANGFGGPALFSPTGFINWGDSSQEVDYYRGVLGVRGDLLSSFTYDLYGQYSKSDASYTDQRILADSIATQDFRGVVLNGNGIIPDGTTPLPFLGTAPSPCEGSGYVTPIGGRPCVDVDWYSPRVMYGDFTPEEFFFLTDTETGKTQYTQWYVEGVVSGDLFDIWGGPVGLAVGGTFRRDEITDTPGDITLAGNAWQAGGAGITAGHSDTLEAFGEISIPLLADLPLIDSLTFTAAGRVTNVKAVRASDEASDSNNGNFTYKLGVDWALTDFLRLRGSYGTSFRAPALFEQFLADQEGALDQRALDPCINWGTALANGDITQSFADNCAADGVAPDHTGTGIDGTVIQGGGLGVLDPETSTAWTASAILTPSFAFLPDTDISIAVDYFNIEVNGEIAQFGARRIINQCYSSDTFPTDPICDLFARIGDLDPSDPYWNAGSASNIAVVRDSFINVSEQKNQGVDVTVRLVHDFPGDVTLSLQGQMTWQTKDTIAIFEDNLEDLNGEAGEPRWVGDFNAQVDVGPWNFFYGLDVIGGTSNVRDYVEDTITGEFDDLTQAQIDDALCPSLTVYPDVVCYDLTISPTFYHSASLTREFGETFRLTAGVSNIFDTRPPRTSNVGGDGINQLGNGVLYSQYDMLGRRAFVNLNIQY